MLYLYIYQLVCTGIKSKNDEIVLLIMHTFMYLVYIFLQVQGALITTVGDFIVAVVFISL